MKKSIFILCAILIPLFQFPTLNTAQAQTEYIVEQPLHGDITKIRVYDGWNVRLVYDTVNLLSIATPCEYYFAEGNEPQICKQHADGWLSLWKNTSMPKGTVVEIHYRHSLQRLDIHPGATVTTDTLLMFDTSALVKAGYGAVNVMSNASLRAKEIRCRRQVGQPGFLAISADTASTVRIGTVRAGYLALWSQRDATLMLDSIDAREVHYRRNPLAHDNLWHSNPDRNIKVKTANRWFAEGLKQLDNTIDFAFNTPFDWRYNSPYANSVDVTTIAGLRTNIIPMNQRFGLSLAINFGVQTNGLANNSTLNGRVLQIDTVSPGVNRQRSITYFYFGLPVRLHYTPISEFGRRCFNDVHLGLEPRVNFHQRYTNGLLGTNNRWDNTVSKVSVYNPLQVRADFGWRFNPFSAIEFNFYVDLLPTYRSGTGMEGIHAFGLQMKF